MTAHQMSAIRTSAVRAAAVIAGALLIVSCSAKQDTQQPATTEPMPAHGSLADCLKANGVTETGGAPVVLGPPAGVDQATWDKAMKSCSSLAPGPAAP